VPRVIIGGFKAAPIRSLETLTHVSPLDLFLTSKVVVYRKRVRNNGSISSLKGPTTGSEQRWASHKHVARTAAATVGHPRPMREGWIEEWMNPGRERGPLGQEKRDIRRALQVRWREKWEAAPCSKMEAIPQPPSEKVLDLYQGLHKAESSLLVQLRTGKIGLRDFLYNIGVPEVTSAACACGHGRETPKHVTVFCPRYHGTREQLRTNGHLDYKTLLTTAEGAKKVTRWWLRRGILEQFRLADKLIE
jgi:hypothetical protein